MALEDITEDSEVAAVVAALALLASPPARRLLRRAAVAGLAHGLEAGRALARVGQFLPHQLRPSAAATEDGLQDIFAPGHTPR